MAPDGRWTGRGVVRLRASDNDEALRALRDDPLYLRGATPREILGLIRVMDRAAAAAPGAALPILHVHGAHDAVTPGRPTREALADAPGPVIAADRPEGWHLLLRDRDGPAVWTLVADFALTGGVATYAAQGPAGEDPT
jgi:alpha-beta hydrolase superfamily lysophospholipase